MPQIETPSSSAPDDVARITATLVPDDKRPRFLYERLGGACVAFEQMCFNTAGEQTVGYTGGLWDFYTLSNGGFFIAPPPSANKNGTYPYVVETNGYTGVLGANEAGIVISLFALNRLMWLHGLADAQLQALDTAYWQLRDFAAQSAAAAEIFRAID